MRSAFVVLAISTFALLTSATSALEPKGGEPKKAVPKLPYGLPKYWDKIEISGEQVFAIAEKQCACSTTLKRMDKDLAALTRQYDQVSYLAANNPQNIPRLQAVIAAIKQKHAERNSAWQEMIGSMQRVLTESQTKRVTALETMDFLPKEFRGRMFTDEQYLRMHPILLKRLAELQAINSLLATNEQQAPDQLFRAQMISSLNRGKRGSEREQDNERRLSGIEDQRKSTAEQRDRLVAARDEVYSKMLEELRNVAQQ